MNNNLNKFSAIALMLIVSMIALIACADGLCASCERVFYTRSDRSRRPLARLVRGLLGGLARVTSPVGASSVLACQGPRAALAPDPSCAALLRVSALRI
ncbi:MAG: hypothetical protein Q8K99_10535 [Actinomycetota bacterium]|nr:hypothetical protein [Actinomycetota bacterium]